MSEKRRVARVDDLEEAGRVVVELNGREIAIFEIDGEYRAYLNWCPHQGGPVCEGELTGRMEASFDRETLSTEFEWTAEAETLVCPWHDWEFDIRTGDCFSGETDLPSYTVSVEDGDIVLDT